MSVFEALIANTICQRLRIDCGICFDTKCIALIPNELLKAYTCLQLLPQLMNLCESVRRKLRRHLNLDSWNSSTMPFEVESSKTLLHEATPDTATRNAGLLQNAKHHDAVHFVACASEVPLCTDMLCGEVSAARVSLAASIKSGKVPPRKCVIMHGNSPAKASFERNLIYMLIRQMSRSLCIF